MFDQPIDAIDEVVLASLVTNQVTERRDLEFKRDLPGRSDEQIKEFLADVTSLANAQGGDLIFGIEDTGGVASNLPGVAVPDTDAEILRLESIIRTGVNPRLAGVRTHWVPLSSGTGAMIIRVPASLDAPHRVTFRNSGRFFNRTSRGKYEMDVHELRHAFTQSEQLPQRFRQLHGTAVSAAHGVDMPFAIAAEPTAVVSVMPLGLFREERDIGITEDHALLPIKARSYDAIDTIEGVLIYTPVDSETGTVRSFALTHRTGRTDVAWKIGGVHELNAGQQVRYVWPTKFEEGLLDATGSTQTKLRQFGVEGPWVVLATIFGVKGFHLVLGDRHTSRAAWRDQAMLAQLVVDRIDEAALLPILKTFWLLFGEQRPEGRHIRQR